MKDKVKQGFSLVEVMISVAVFTIVLGAIHQIFVSGQKTWDSDLNLLDLQQTVRRGLYSATRELRAASLAGITIPAGCDHLSSPENCNQITFNIPSESNIQFLHDNLTNQLIRQDASGGQRILASNITNAYFCCSHGDGNCGCSATYDILEIQLQAEKTSWGRNLNFALRTKLKVRND
ncbi:MAG: prepilin-type N-terminal cleavage/methylation domain-containing protein [Candidatus Omnitrophota bacterium]